MAENLLRFHVYKHQLVIGEDNLISRQFIVLRDNNKNIVSWTNFHLFIKSGKNKAIRRVTDDGNMRFYYVCNFLNYLYFDKYQISSLRELNIEMLKTYFNEYGLGKMPGDKQGRRKETVEKCIASVLDFIECLSKNYQHLFLFNTKALYKEAQAVNFRSARRITYTKKVPAFEVLYSDCEYHREIFRDMPNGVFEIYMDQILQKHKRLLMLAALSAFGGMRPSEACNVRREDSAVGKGIYINEENGEVFSVSIDLLKERVLRSDLLKVGNIKKERMQDIHPAFLKTFVDLYDIYMDYIKGQPYEVKYGALTTNNNGKAMTYNTYYHEFREVTKEVIPRLLTSNDRELVTYGHLLLENNISPHIFRHWFSVQLTIMGSDVAQLQYWRGDSSPESSIVYLQNKSELTKKYYKVTNEIFNYQMWKSEKVNDRKK